VEYYIPEADSYFRANNMALLAPQMLNESRPKEFDVASAPYTKLFITREDGQLVTLLYERSTGTFAWGRVTTGEVLKNTMSDEEKNKAKEEWEKKVDESRRQYALPHPGSFVQPQKLERVIESRVQCVTVLPGPDGYDDIYLSVERNGVFYLERLREAGMVYLDSWKEWKWETPEEKTSLLAQYTSDAVVYDVVEDKTYRLNGDLPEQSQEGRRRWIGYKYTSILRSMPVQPNEKMHHANITGLQMRISDSFVPRAREKKDAWDSSESSGMEPKSGVEVIDFIGGADRTAQFEILTDKPGRCCVLSVYGRISN
jgi:hypothetical protein